VPRSSGRELLCIMLRTIKLAQNIEQASLI
jgi:hypothetical protein